MQGDLQTWKPQKPPHLDAQKAGNLMRFINTFHGIPNAAANVQAVWSWRALALIDKSRRVHNSYISSKQVL